MGGGDYDDGNVAHVSEKDVAVSVKTVTTKMVSKFRGPIGIRINAYHACNTWWQRIRAFPAHSSAADDGDREGFQCPHPLQTPGSLITSHTSHLNGAILRRV